MIDWTLQVVLSNYGPIAYNTLLVQISVCSQWTAYPVPSENPKVELLTRDEGELEVNTTVLACHYWSTCKNVCRLCQLSFLLCCIECVHVVTKIDPQRLKYPDT